MSDRKLILFVPAPEHEKELLGPQPGGGMPSRRWTVPGVDQWWDYQPCPNLHSNQTCALVLCVDDEPDIGIVALVRLMDVRAWWTALWASYSRETVFAICYEAEKCGYGETLEYWHDRSERTLPIERTRSQRTP